MLDRLVLAALLTVVLGACGNLTAGGFGEVDVHGSGDADEAPAASPSPSVTSESPQAAPPAPAGAGVLEGTLDVELDVFLVGQGGSEHRITPNAGTDVQLDLGGSDEPLIAEDRTVPAGDYVGIRFDFGEVVADVDGGLVIGAVEFVGIAHVAIGPSGLDVEVPVSFTVPEDGRASLLVDFNSDEWLLDLDLLTSTVAGAAFAQRIAVTVR